MKKKNEENTGTSIQNIKESRRLELSRQKLSNPIEYKWPQLTDEVDHQIQLRLQRAFEPYGKCLRKVKKRPSWAMFHWINDTKPLTPKEEEDKIHFKNLFCFGISSVIKGLERDELRLVLIWKATQPPELKKAVLSLVARTGCPAASISDVLHPVKASYEALSCLTAMGVKKSSSPNVFDDLVEYVKSEVPVSDIPEIPKTTKHAMEMEETTDTSIEASDGTSNNPGVCDTPDFNKINDQVKKRTEKTLNASSKTDAKIKETFTEWCKYDIHAPVNKDEKKSFDGQDFIRFSVEKCPHVVEITEDEQMNSEMSFGIAASLIVPNDSGIKEDRNADRNNVTNKGKKRKFGNHQSKTEVASGYKQLSIKQLKSNPNKKKKKFKLKKLK